MGALVDDAELSTIQSIFREYADAMGLNLKFPKFFDFPRHAICVLKIDPLRVSSLFPWKKLAIGPPGALAIAIPLAPGRLPYEMARRFFCASHIGTANRRVNGSADGQLSPR
jgi:hypothetical protein